MRTAPASIAAQLDQTTERDHSLSLARCAKIVLRDGTELGFTDHDASLTVALSNDFYGALTYSAGHGMIVGDIDLRVGLDADNTEMSFPINELISREAVLSRRFHNANAYLFDVDWSEAAPEPLEIMAGYIAEARPEQGTAVFEIRSQADRWNSPIGRLLSPRCSADFGDVKCGKTPTNYACSVASEISNMRFRVDVAGIALDDFFRFGEVEFLTGSLAGTWPYEIVRYDASDKEVEVLSPMPGFCEVGDQLLLRDGCSRVKKSDDPTVPTCATHANQRRFRGFDQVPGSDRFLRFPIPGNAEEA